MACASSRQVDAESISGIKTGGDGFVCIYDDITL
jgi:hypothetical protein